MDRNSFSLRNHPPHVDDDDDKKDDEQDVSPSKKHSHDDDDEPTTMMKKTPRNVRQSCRELSSAAKALYNAAPYC